MVKCYGAGCPPLPSPSGWLRHCGCHRRYLYKPVLCVSWCYRLVAGHILLSFCTYLLLPPGFLFSTPLSKCISASSTGKHCTLHCAGEIPNMHACTCRFSLLTFPAPFFVLGSLCDIIAHAQSGSGVDYSTCLF